MQKRYLSVANFDKTQMYKDRNPIWIKLHCSILSDYEFSALPDETKFHALGLMVFASRFNNKFPEDEAWLRRQINANSEINLKLLIEIGFLEVIKGTRIAVKKSLNARKSNNLNGEFVNESEKLCELEQNRTEENKTEHSTAEQSAGAKPGEDAPENVAAVCANLKSFGKKAEEVFSKNKSGSEHLSKFSLAECFSYVQLCIAKGEPIKNAKALATSFYKTGESDIFIRAAMFPEDQKQVDLETYGAPVRFSALPCSVCFGAKMADAGGKGFRKCEHCKNEKGNSTGLEPEGENEND